MGSWVEAEIDTVPLTLADMQRDKKGEHEKKGK
jgi:hypothetical protein